MWHDDINIKFLLDLIPYHFPSIKSEALSAKNFQLENILEQFEEL